MGRQFRRNRVPNHVFHDNFSDSPLRQCCGQTKRGQQATFCSVTHSLSLFWKPTLKTTALRPCPVTCLHISPILSLNILHVIICVDPRYVSNARSAPAGFLFGKCSLSGHSYSPPFPPPPKPVLREHVSFSGIRKRVKNIRFGTTIPKEQSTKPCFSRQLF